MSTLKFDEAEAKSDFKLQAIENLAKELIRIGCKFKLSDLKDGKKIQGSFEDLKLLQVKLAQAKLPTGEILMK